MWLILALALGLAANAEPACRKHNPKAADVPECPANGSTILPDNYPVMAVSVSDEHGKGEFAADFVVKALRGQGEKPPQFMLNVSDESLQRIKSAVAREAGMDKKKLKLWMDSLSRVNGKVYNWQQDFMQSYQGPDGRPVTRELGHYRSREGEKLYKSLSTALSEACGVKSGDPIYPDPNTEKDGYSGGNIEGGPGGICLFGKDNLDNDEFKKHTPKVCGGGTPVEAPTDFLRVGHTDEMTATLRTGPGECDQVMFIASPRAALAVMEKDPGGRAFAFTESRDGSALSDTDSLYKICKQFLENQKGLGDTPAEPTRAVPERGGSYFHFLAPFANARILIQNSDGKMETLPASDRRSTQNCNDMTNAQFLEAFKKHHEFPEINRIIDGKMDQFRKDAESAWKKNSPQCEPRFEEMPTLFGGRLSEKGKNVRSALSMLPNVNNVQQFGKSVLIPDPQSAALRADITERLKKAGLKADFINTNKQHSQEGNLHCTTNTMRYCRPRAKGN